MMDIAKPKTLNQMLSEFDDASDDVLKYEAAMMRAARRRSRLVREMLTRVPIEELSRITGLRIIRLRQLEEKR